jgi:hypothetical protein
MTLLRVHNFNQQFFGEKTMKSLFVSVLSAATLSLLSATATPVAAQVSAESGSKVVYSVDSLESTEAPVDISIKEEVIPVDSLEQVSAPADKKAVKLVIKGVPTSILMPVAPVSTPADTVETATPVAVPVTVNNAGDINPSVEANKVDKKAVAQEVPTSIVIPVPPATPVALPVVSPSVDASPSVGKTVSKESPTSVVIPVPAPRRLEIPGESRVGNATSRSRKASPLVGTNVQAVQSFNPFVGSKTVVSDKSTATQPVSEKKADRKVANIDIRTAQPFNTIVESKAVASPLVGTEIPATQSSNLGVGSKVVIVNPAQPVSNTDSKAAANPLVSKEIPATQPSNENVGSKVATSPSVGNQVQMAQSASETGSKVVFNPVLNTGVMNGFVDKPKPVSPSVDTKAEVCDPANLENSIKIRAPDLGSLESRVSGKYSNPCAKTTATLGYNANVDQSGQRSVDLEVTQGVGNFEFSAKTNLKPAIALQSAGIKWSNKKVTLEATRDFVEPSVKGKIGIEFPMFKGQPDTGLIEMEVHALDNGPVDGRVAATYTRPTSKTKAVLGANFSNTSTSADLEITQGIGDNLEITAKAGLIPTVELQSVGAKLNRGGWSLEVKRDLLGQAWEGQVQYSIKF